MLTPQHTLPKRSTRMAALVVVASTLLALQACKSASIGENFVSEDAPSPVNQVAQTQAAASAARDLSLQPHHFEADRLNSLGADKLNLILRHHGPTDHLTLYLNLPTADATTAAREQTVRHFLTSSGWPDSSITLLLGPNPNHQTPAAPHLARLKQTDSRPSTPSDASPMNQLLSELTTRK